MTLDFMDAVLVKQLLSSMTVMQNVRLVMEPEQSLVNRQ